MVQLVRLLQLVQLVSLVVSLVMSLEVSLVVILRVTLRVIQMVTRVVTRVVTPVVTPVVTRVVLLLFQSRVPTARSVQYVPQRICHSTGGQMRYPSQLIAITSTHVNSVIIASTSQPDPSVPRMLFGIPVGVSAWT